MRVKVGGRKVITFACGNYTVRGQFVSAPSHCLLHGSGCRVVSVVAEEPREDEYDRNTKTWKPVKRANNASSGLAVCSCETPVFLDGWKTCGRCSLPLANR